MSEFYLMPVGGIERNRRKERTISITEPKKTVIVDKSIYNYDDIFEKAKSQNNVLYSLENRGKVHGLFERTAKDKYVSLTRTENGGIIEKVKNGATSLIAKYTKEGKLTDLIEETGSKISFINRAGKYTEMTGKTAVEQMNNIVRGIKIV